MAVLRVRERAGHRLARRDVERRLAVGLSVVLFGSLQDSPVSSQPALTSSVAVYVPGLTSRASVPPSVSENVPRPVAVVVKPNEAASPSGSVCFSTISSAVLRVRERAGHRLARRDVERRLAGGLVGRAVLVAAGQARQLPAGLDVLGRRVRARLDVAPLGRRRRSARTCRAPGAVVVKPKEAASPLGSVCFSTIEPAGLRVRERARDRPRRAGCRTSPAGAACRSCCRRRRRPGSTAPSRSRPSLEAPCCVAGKDVENNLRLAVGERRRSPPRTR